MHPMLRDVASSSNHPKRQQTGQDEPTEKRTDVRSVGRAVELASKPSGTTRTPVARSLAGRLAS